MGYLIKDGVQFFGNNSVPLTQAQYDALVEAGTVDPTAVYFITDRCNSSGEYASEVAYDNTDSGLDATNVQNAIDEIVEDGIPADTIPYDNTTSGLTATDMQSAIDEVVGDIDTLTASQIGYSNTTSGLTATDTQAAVDELADDIANNITATQVNYSNTTSGLTADDVQEAIDELATEDVPATRVSYDNTSSGLAATDVQEAIDEVNNNLITATNTVTTLTLTPKVTFGGNLYAYRMGKLILITGYVLPQSNWISTTVIATISGCTLVQTLFATPAKQETGVVDRVLAVNKNNEISIETETYWASGYFRSFTMFGFLN